MKHAIIFNPGISPETLEMDYACEIGKADARCLLPHIKSGELPVSTGEISSTGHFPLYARTGAARTFPVAGLHWVVPIVHEGSRWALSNVMTDIIFDAKNIRYAYVFLRRIMHSVEDAFILAAPAAPMDGLVQTFDVRFDIPKTVTQFETLRRNILVRERR